MADEKPTGAWGSSLVVVAFAAVTAFYVGWQQKALVSSRPSEIEYPAHELRSGQNVDARLWEDPIGAVMRDVEAQRGRAPAAPGGHGTPGFEDWPDTTLVLGVTLPGASYPEVAETRRRLRYAVLSALHVAGFHPTDEKHIGYWRPTGGETPAKASQAVPIFQKGWPGTTSVAAPVTGFEPDLGIATRTAAGGAQPQPDAAPHDAPLVPIVPWEKFDHDHDPRQHVLVLWLDEDFLTAERRPIASLVALWQRFPADSRFVLLGPEDSTMLNAMAAEAWLHKAYAEQFQFPVYNFGATAEVRHIVGDDWPIGDELKIPGINHYYPIVNTDEKLARALACELMRRDPNLRLHVEGTCSGMRTPGDHRDHVVLLSDWDTFYGRWLINTVATTFSGQESGVDRKWIRQVGYLRGLDGRLPDQKFAGRQTTSQSDGEGEKGPGQEPAAQQKAATPDTASRFESAEGQSQFDYLRRLAADLKERDATYRREDESHIAAVGVLGSDVYDKLLILQALRPELPEALFFTTDLDELLLPQTKARYTRNLLVASSFDLKLMDRLQQDIPPFRNSYQTSIFLAAQLAIQNELRSVSSTPPSGHANASMQNIGSRATAAPASSACGPATAGPDADRSACRGQLPPSWLTAEPRLFQIGRTTAEPLQPAEDEDTSCDPGNIFNCRSIHPRVGELYPALGTSAIFILTILLLSLAFSTRLIRSQFFHEVSHTEGLTRSVNPRVEPLLGALASAAIVSFAFWWVWPNMADYLTGHGSGEPMALLEGISLWPSILVRVFGILLTLWLVCCTLRTLGRNLHETEREMSLSPSPKTIHGEWDLVREEWDKISREKIAYPTAASGIAALLWFTLLPSEEGLRPQVCFEDLTGGFAGRPSAGLFRASIATVLMVGVGWILTKLFGVPNIPGRGSLAPCLFNVVTIVEALLTIFLIFFVADATLVSRAFIKRLTAVKTIWPKAALDVYGTDLVDWIDMHFLARRTRSITGIIYFPFVALAVLVVSRSALFDDFATAWPIVITQSLSAAIVIGSAIALRLTAERARAVACERISGQIIASEGDAADRLGKVLDEVKNLNDGAFAPWTSQPLARAVLLPLLTYGGTVLLHAFALPGS
jgi:hypothetical protein